MNLDSIKVSKKQGVGVVSESVLSKVNWIGFAGMLILGGISWGTLSADVVAVDDKAKAQAAQHTKDIDSITDDQKEMAGDINDIKISMTASVVEQRYMKENQEKILQILQRQYPSGH